MCGHSKWATIKHKKGAADAKRGKLFAKLIRQVEVAARRGRWRSRRQPDAAHDVPEGARRLGAARHHRTGHQAGDRRARGRQLRADHLRGLRPRWGGRARRGADRQSQPHRARRSARSSRRTAARWPSPGAVAWQFERKGVVIVPRTVDEDELMVVGARRRAEDLADEGDIWRLTCEADVDRRISATRSRTAASRSSRPTSR